MTKTTRKQPTLQKIEAARGFAAVYVVLYHYTQQFTKGWGMAALPLRLGPEAVMLFFLISGFVITLNTEKKRPSFLEYLVHRFRRIFPLFMIALAIGVIDVCVVQGRPLPAKDLFGNLLMLQDLGYTKPGTWFPPFAGIDPLWSLSYEWWFYMLFFPIWTCLRARLQLPVAIALSMIGLLTYLWCPNQPAAYAMYFVLWWTGAEFAREFAATGKVTFFGQRFAIASLVIFVSVGSLSLLHQKGIYGGYQGLGEFPWLQIRQLCSALFIALLALLWNSRRWVAFDKIFRPFLIVAPISYALYLFHVPLLVYKIHLPVIGGKVFQECAAVFVLISCSLIAEFWLQPKVNRLLQFWPLSHRQGKA